MRKRSLSRVRLRVRKAKRQATLFSIKLDVALVIIMVTILAVKLTIAVNVRTEPLGKVLVAYAVNHDSSTIKAVAKDKVSYKKIQVAKAPTAPKREDRGLNVSRSAPFVRPVGESTHTIAWINSLNKFLAGSPMSGMGEIFYKTAKAKGIDPRLSPSIAKVESGLGRATPGGYNAFGMTAGTAPGHSRNGSWQAFGSWQEAIQRNISFIGYHWGSVKSPFRMRGYATSTVWMRHVSSVMSTIQNPGPEPPPPVLGPAEASINVGNNGG